VQVNSGNSANPHIATPADASTTLTIGAVDASENYVSFSSIGPSSDGRVKPDVCAKGLSATVSNTSGGITTASGTSFSSPIMAGMVASFWSAVPNMTNAQVVQFVKQSADLYSNPTVFKGYGIPDFQLALNNALSLNSNEVTSIVLYPNPVKDKFTLHLPNNETEAKLVLYNNIGQEVSFYKITETISTVYLENLASGLYFYQVEFANQSAKGKLLKL